MNERRIEILYFDDCPNVDDANARVRDAIEAAGTPGVLVEHVCVATADAAESMRFLGSPSVRVDGVDVEPGARSRTDFGLQCRVYDVGGHLEGAPPAEWIRRLLNGEAADAGTSAAAVPRANCCSRSSR